MADPPPALTTLTRRLADGTAALPDKPEETAEGAARALWLAAAGRPVSVEAALALGSLKRMGFAITVVAVMLSDEELEKAYGRVLSEGIRDFRHLKDEAELSSLCQRQMQVGAMYSPVVSLVD